MKPTWLTDLADAKEGPEPMIDWDPYDEDEGFEYVWLETPMAHSKLEKSWNDHGGEDSFFFDAELSEVVDELFNDEDWQSAELFPLPEDEKLPVPIRKIRTEAGEVWLIFRLRVRIHKSELTMKKF